LINPASLPSTPSFPNRPLFAMGGFGGGLALGLGLGFLLEMRDTSLRTERDVELSLQLPVLAMVPTIKPSSRSKSTQPVGQTPAHSGVGVGTGA